MERIRSITQEVLLSRPVENYRIAADLLKNQIATYHMAQHFWKDVLHKDPVRQPGFTIGNIASGGAYDAIPFSYALEDKSLPKMITRREKPKNITFQNFDIEPIYIEQAIKQFPYRLFSDDKRSYIQADVREHIPAEDNSFDLCLFKNVLLPAYPPYVLGSTLPSNQLLQVFDEMTRVLKPHGILWVTVFDDSEKTLLVNVFNNNKNQERYSTLFVGENPFREGDHNHIGAGDSYVLLAQKNELRV